MDYWKSPLLLLLGYTSIYVCTSSYLEGGQARQPRNGLTQLSKEFHMGLLQQQFRIQKSELRNEKIVHIISYLVDFASKLISKFFEIFFPLCIVRNFLQIARFWIFWALCATAIVARRYGNLGNLVNKLNFLRSNRNFLHLLYNMPRKKGHWGS